MTTRISIRTQLMTANAFRRHGASKKIALSASEADRHDQVLDAIIKTLERIDGREELIRGLILFPDIADRTLAEIKARQQKSET